MSLEIDDEPKVTFKGNTVYITGKSFPEDARPIWLSIVSQLKNFAYKRRELEINFVIDYASSSTSWGITQMFDYLSSIAHKCKIEFNWFYFEADWSTYENGESYKELYQNVNVNLIIR